MVEVLGYEAGGLLRERTVEVDGRSYRTRIRQRGRDGRIERLDVPLSGSSSGVRSIGYQYDNPGFLRAVEPYGSMTLNETTVVENYSFDEWGIPRGAD